MSHNKELIAKLTRDKVIASGGIHALSDLEQLKAIGVYGTIVGKAYYSGRISLAELVEVEE